MVKNSLKLQFHKTYFALTVLLFCIEVLIAMYVHDTIVRPYIGDVLVVILIYCFIKSFLDLKVITAAIFVLLFSFGVETLQYLAIVDKLHLQNSKMARTVIGTSFSWIDILTYVIGIGMVLLVEKTVKKSY
ncbi:DUF2809 domain-containing protein [Flavobacterium sp. N1994]|uniref:ribosomal maturation YjgA family protein n=1 Tax=Flavobacterium sp. N1994 TaxID=2986827 RepID=UPI0022233CD7|nr:DUF2809 domain-containing protein [Flavobacterium sp. N1994]